MKGVFRLVTPGDVIYEMVKVYVEQFLSGLDESRIRGIVRILTRAGVRFSISQFNKEAIGGIITTAICASFSMKATTMNRLKVISAGSIKLFGAYGIVDNAAKAAQRLKIHNPWYYQALYQIELEMFYFLVEGTVVGERLIFGSASMESNEKIASAIMRMTQK